MRGLAIGLALLLAAPVAAGQSSDPAIGSRLGNRTQAGKAGAADEAIKTSYTHARCIYFNRDRTVRRWLTTVDRAEYESAGREVFASVECDSMAFADPWVDSLMVANSNANNRGALAEVALRKEGKLNPKVGPLPALPLQEGYNSPWFAMTGRPASLDAMAACFTDTQPQLVFQLLRTDPTSSDEKAAIGQVAAQLGNCLIGGAKLKANAYVLRTALAEAYFHRVYGPGAMSAAGANSK